ncbi:hypothetical protein [Cupriavidus pauculus]|nr:hypothetical protein [Cupriavidus pauculus]
MMIVLLAFLPLQAWAGMGASASVAGMARAAHTVTVAPAAAGAERTDLAHPADLAALADVAGYADAAPDAPDPSLPGDTAEPTPPGADFAEQLLPAPLPRVATSGARGTVPRYAAAALPDPDLPLPPRPPRG